MHSDEILQLDVATFGSLGGPRRAKGTRWRQRPVRRTTGQRLGCSGGANECSPTFVSVSPDDKTALRRL